MVVVRPDGYVGAMTPLEKLEIELSSYFAKFLQQEPHSI